MVLRVRVRRHRKYYSVGRSSGARRVLLVSPVQHVPVWLSLPDHHTLDVGRWLAR